MFMFIGNIYESLLFMKEVLKYAKVYERQKYICVYYVKEVYYYEEEVHVYESILYEWYVSRITYTNGDIV